MKVGLSGEKRMKKLDDKFIDYIITKYNNNGFNQFEFKNESIIIQQLKYFYEKDKNKKGYIKALYLHHLLDFFKETYVNIYNLDLVFEKFLENKVVVEMNDSKGKKIIFQEDIDAIFDLVRKNKEELFKDLKL